MGVVCDYQPDFLKSLEKGDEVPGNLAKHEFRGKTSSFSYFFFKPTPTRSTANIAVAKGNTIREEVQNAFLIPLRRIMPSHI